MDMDKCEDELQERFRGCMLGAVLGDCLGGPLEFKNGNNSFPFSRLKREFRLYDAWEPERDGVLEFSDDTAMSRQLAYSLLETKTHLDPRNLARRFVDEYHREQGRGYGEAVTAVFEKLHKSDCCDPFGPAKEQFQNEGSFGNGAAMRVHPVAMFCHGRSRAELLEMAEASARITHSHQLGVRGAQLQAYAVALALDGVDREPFLAKMLELVESFGEDPKSKQTYRYKFEIICKALATKNDDLALSLGNGVAALHSVPSAIFSFLRAQSPIEQLRDSSRFVRTVQLAISFGGDTDTIGSMAGAMAGAYYGEVDVPENFLDVCEGVYDAIKQADGLVKLVRENLDSEVSEPIVKRIKIEVQEIEVKPDIQLDVAEPEDVKPDLKPDLIKAEPEEASASENTREKDTVQPDGAPTNVTTDNATDIKHNIVK